MLKRMMKRTSGMKLLSTFLVLAMVVCFAGFTNIDTAAAATTSVTIKVDDYYTLATYSSTELENDMITFDQDRYSVLNDFQTKKLYCCEGPELEEVLTTALENDPDTSLNQVKSIQFKADDGASVTLTKAELLDTTHYYYPNIMDGTTDGAVAVPTRLATQAASGTDYANLDAVKCLRLFVGQTGLDNINNGYMLKYIDEINLITY